MSRPRSRPRGTRNWEILRPWKSTLETRPLAVDSCGAAWVSGLSLAWQGRLRRPVRMSPLRSRSPTRRPSRATASSRTGSEMHTVTVGTNKGDLVGSTEKVIQAAVDQVAARRRRHRADPAGNVPASQRDLPAVAHSHHGDGAGIDPHQGAMRLDQAGGQLGLVRPGGHARRCPRVPGRRRRLLPGQESRHRRAHRDQANARGPFGQPVQARQGPAREPLAREGRADRGHALPPALGRERRRHRHRAPDARRQSSEQREPRRQLRGLHLRPGLQPAHLPRRDRPEQQRRRHLLAGLPRRPRRELPEPRPRGTGPAPRLGLAAADHPAQPGPAEPTSASSSAGACGSAWPRTTPSRTSAPRAISLGHRDTDNLVRDNTITRSGKVGILFRDERKEFAAHRNRIEQNRIVDSGPADGIGIDVRGQTEYVTLAGNEIRETRAARCRGSASGSGRQTTDVTLAGNRLSGFATEVRDIRLSSS